MATSKWGRILFRNKNKAQNKGRMYFKVFFLFGARNIKWEHNVRTASDRRILRTFICKPDDLAVIVFVILV